MNPYLKAALTTAITMTIIGALVGYFSYQLVLDNARASAPPGSSVRLETIGPFSGWFDTWFVATTVGIVVSLPRSLVRARRKTRMAPPETDA
ncbi:hypothetical protein ACFVH6_21995 [Spirillospora sp. NPDC127200]